MMATRVLAAYCTGFRTTKTIAEAITRVLADNELYVDLMPVNSIVSVAPYSGVVLGVGIRAGIVEPQALQFLKKHQEYLSGIPVAYFTLCLTMMSHTKENRMIATCWTQPMRSLVEPVDIGIFAGRLALKEFPSAEGLLRMLLSSPECDCQNWDQIEAWAKHLIPVFEGNVFPLPVAERVACEFISGNDYYPKQLLAGQ
jgi:menaquinone-dependent protoporphyrinogen oxidase